MLFLGTCSDGSCFAPLPLLLSLLFVQDSALHFRSSPCQRGNTTDPVAPAADDARRMDHPVNLNSGLETVAAAQRGTARKISYPPRQSLALTVNTPLHLKPKRKSLVASGGNVVHSESSVPGCAWIGKLLFDFAWPIEMEKPGRRLTTGSQNFSVSETQTNMPHVIITVHRKRET